MKNKDRRLTVEEFKREFPEMDFLSKIPGHYRMPTIDEISNPFMVAPGSRCIYVLAKSETGGICPIRVKEYEPTRLEKIQMKVQALFDQEDDD